MKIVFVLLSILLFNVPSNSQISQQWLARYSVGPYSNVSAIGTDVNGNVFITGWSGNDGLTVKYNSSGAQQWAMIYNGPPALGDYLKALAIDASGNVFVTGYSNGGFPTPNDDYITIKYNSAGVQQWTARYNGIGNDRDNAFAICLDATGNSYVTGWSYTTTATGSTDYATVKYNSSGVQQWAVRYNGPGNNSDYANAICSDNNGYVYVTGGSYSSSSFNSNDYATVKYNSSGVQQWVARYNGPFNSGDDAVAIAVDNSYNVYVTGNSANVGSGSVATIKYNSLGQLLWVQRFDSSYAIGMKVDNSGNVYVEANKNDSYATIKYNTSGTQQWVRYYTGPVPYSRPNAIEIDAAGSVYVTGVSGVDYATIKYNTNGVQQWLMQYHEPRINMTAIAQGIALDSSSNVIVTGVSSQEALTDIGTVKYSQITGVTPASNEIPKQFSLSQNFPNPFNPSTNISYQLPDPEFISLKVYDNLGNEVITLVNEKQNAGSYSVNFNAASLPGGIYFYKLVTENFSETKKMVLIK